MLPPLHVPFCMKHSIATICMALMLCSIAFAKPERRRVIHPDSIIPQMATNVTVDVSPMKPGAETSKVDVTVSDVKPNAFVEMTKTEIGKVLASLTTSKVAVSVASVMQQLLQQRVTVEVEKIVAAIVSEKYSPEEVAQVAAILQRAQRSGAAQVMSGLYMAHVLNARRPFGAPAGETIEVVTVTVEEVNPGDPVEKAILEISGIAKALLAEHMTPEQIVAILKALGIQSTEVIVGSIMLGAESELAIISLTGVVEASLADKTDLEVRQIVQAALAGKSQAVAEIILEAAIVHGTAVSVKTILNAMQVNYDSVTVASILKKSLTNKTELQVMEIMQGAFATKSIVMAETLLEAAMSKTINVPVETILREMQVEYDIIVIINVMRQVAADRTSLVVHEDEAKKGVKKASVDIYDTFLDGKLRWLILQIETARKEGNLEKEEEYRRQSIDMFNEWLENPDAPTTIDLDEPM